MFSVFTSFFTAISNFCTSFTTAKERQSETDVLKSKKTKTKAVECAEKIIFYVERKFDSLATDKTYQRLKKQFFKYN